MNKRDIAIGTLLVVIATSFIFYVSPPSLVKLISYSPVEFPDPSEKPEVLLMRAQKSQENAVAKIQDIIIQYYEKRQICVLIGGIALGLLLGIIVSDRKTNIK